MSQQFLDFEGLDFYNKNVEKRITDLYYDKDQIDNIVSMLEMDVLWKEAVNTYDDIATTYPFPQTGWTVITLDTGAMYRFDGAEWVKISSNFAPKATATNDGLMPKEMYSKVDSLGTAAMKDSITTVDRSYNLPTSRAVQDYVIASLQQLSEGLEEEINTKVGITDVGDASGKNYTDTIPEATEKVEIYGEWYSQDGTDTFYLKGTGVNEGIDLSYFEPMNDYTIHMGLVNYSSDIDVKLRLIGTKERDGVIYPVDVSYVDGDTISVDSVPDEILSGDSSGLLEFVINGYVAETVTDLDLLVFPVIHDNGQDEDIIMINMDMYVNPQIIHQEYDDVPENHIVKTKYGMYSSADLPTSTAVSTLVRTVADALGLVLNTRIDDVEAKIDDYEEATDEDIENLFDFGNQEASDEDIENLFG